MHISVYFLCPNEANRKGKNRHKYLNLHQVTNDLPMLFCNFCALDEACYPPILKELPNHI